MNVYQTLSCAVGCAFASAVHSAISSYSAAAERRESIWDWQSGESPRMKMRGTDRQQSGMFSRAMVEVVLRNMSMQFAAPG